MYANSMQSDDQTKEYGAWRRWLPTWYMLTMFHGNF